MCCFTRPVPFVGATKIFARRAPNARQLLAYAMDVELDTELAMVLPLPVPPRPSDDAVTFVNLEGYPHLFADLAKAFPPLMVPAARGMALLSLDEAPAKLVVHDVGLFEASFVPTRADFVRLDERFQLPDGVWDAVPAYADWGFAVFQLKPQTSSSRARQKQSIHPMALSFPTRSARALYFPLLHVHDGRSVESHAAFDHALYCQADGVLEATLGWARSKAALGAWIDGARANGVVDGARHGFLEPLVGRLANTDLWLREPEGVTLEDLRGDGECHAYEVSAAYGHRFGVEDPRLQRWQRTASTRLDALCRGMREGLRELVAQRRAAWDLAPLSDDLPAHFINGRQLWSGTSFMNGAPATGTGPARVRFAPFSDHVEVQSVTLGFASLPDHDRVQEINAELSRLLDHAVATSG
ncbi:MAG: hypothetical protein KF819_39800 [Labilithrix sp.]|nr:hypothetical protein [Labilithrix sp.]